MTFNDNVQIDNSGLGSGGGGGGGIGRGGMVAGGGIGGLILLLVTMLFNGLGGNGNDPGTNAGVSTQEPAASADGNMTRSEYQQQVAKYCRTGADANKYDVCRVQATWTSANSYWRQTFKAAGRPYTQPNISLFQGRDSSPCGTASAETGPFYCPTDQRIYIDVSFFKVLTQRFGSSNGALAQEYVVAHEFGHHIQNKLGVLKYAQDGQGADSGSVRVELMADCLAGVWANHASKPDANGNAFLKPLTQQDIKDALSAAASVGDDRIQESTQGRTNPETYTHGTSAQRQKWFLQGYQSGTINQCNTIKSANLG